jgi:2-methylcitrate dehydratase
MAEYAVALKYTDLPYSVVHEVKRRIIDSLGCALGAWQAPPCVIARKVAASFGARAGAIILGTRSIASPDWAAFANGCAVRYLDYNDTYLSKEPAHPSDNIPAALAAADSEGSGGRDLITAIALAYEVQCRLCDAASIRSRGWDHVTYGAFSSALAASRLMRLNVEKTVQAVGIAGVASAALRQSRVGELSHWKGCAFANAARHGVFAAMLARAGMTGPAPIFEGEKGFEQLVSGPLDLQVNRWGNRRNADFMILRTSIKYWPAEYHSQSAIEAALKLRAQIGDAAEIKSVVVQSHAAAVDIIGSEPEKWRPTSRETADHSLPYIVAATLADGEITGRQFSAKRFSDPELLALTRRVKVERNAELTSRYPNAVANIVRVRLSDGRTLAEQVDYPHGHAENPLTDSEVEAKFRQLSDRVIGGSRAEAALRWMWQIEEHATPRKLWRLMELGVR